MRSVGTSELSQPLRVSLGCLAGLLLTCCSCQPPIDNVEICEETQAKIAQATEACVGEAAPEPTLGCEGMAKYDCDLQDYWDCHTDVECDNGIVVVPTCGLLSPTVCEDR